MSLIKVNHNNAAVKLPPIPDPILRYSRTIDTISGVYLERVFFTADPNEPDPYEGHSVEIYLNGNVIGYLPDDVDDATATTVQVERVFLTVYPNIQDPFFVDYEFEVYLNGNIVGYVNPGSDHEIVITDNPELRKPYFSVQLKGRYYGKNGYVYEFEKETQVFRYYHLCSEDTYCGELIMASDFYEGYLHDNAFYSGVVYDDETGGFVYLDMLPGLEGARYFDIQSDRIFSYNYINGEYEPIA